MVKNSSLLRVVASLRPDRSRRAGIVVVAFFTSALAGVGVAEDRFYVMPGGQRVRVTKSADEYGLVLRSCDDAKACAKRLSAEGHGTLESFKWAPHARMKLLRVAKTSAAGKVAIRRDPVIQDVRPVYRFEGLDAPAMSTGTIAAKLRPNVSDAAREQLWKDHGIAKVEPIIGQPRAYRLTPVDEDDDEVLLSEVLSGDARVLWAQPNFRRAVDTRQVTPSDPLYRLQWHLNNTGQVGGREGADIDALEAWAITGGEGILFGTFDDSCDVDHEDLRDNYIGVGQDASLESNAEGADDPRPKEVGDRHGTAVMGLAVARANNLGVRGVAHAAQFTASRGLGDIVTDVEVARVFTFARQQNVDVHINSWGFFGPDPAVVVDSLDLAFREGRNKGDLDGDGDDDPLGMVIVFASGNDGVQLSPGFELSMLHQVIGVGASNDEDVRSSYSNYGTGIDVLAPSNDILGICIIIQPGSCTAQGVCNAGNLGAVCTADEQCNIGFCATGSAACTVNEQCGDFRADLVTTDNTDSQNAIDLGYNVGGFSADEFNRQEVEPTGKYTGSFGGTSGACPIAAGVAGLVLSVNPMLSATDVRLILEHTADRISPAVATYNTITSRSLRYGYGRINAGGAVEAAQETLTNGGKTWPDRPGDLHIEGLSIRWTQNLGTDEFLVVQSESAFDFIPLDGKCYDVNQDSCGGELRSLPAGVGVLATSCNLKCTETDATGCEAGAAQCVPFNAPASGKKWFFGIYARSTSGRYSFGVAADSNGTVTDSGDVVGGGDPGGVPTSGGPSVTIIVSDQELEGASPWTVHFNGDADSDVAIDESRTAWDFDVGDDHDSPDAIATRTPTKTYSVDPGMIRTFVARLTMYDIQGHSGSDEVAIRVQGPDVDVSDSDVRIIVGLPGSPNSDVDGGTAPFSVLLSIDATGLSETVELVVVAWDLGDGTRITAQSVQHIYENNTDFAIGIPIVATVTTTSGGTTTSTTATRIITVEPGSDVVDSGVPILPGTTPEGEGGSATPPCSGIGMIPLLLTLTSLLWMRRRY